MTIEELKVLITLETSGMERELGKVKSLLRGFDKGVSKTSTRINKAFNNMFQVAKVAGITLAFGKVGKSAVSLASSLEEVQNVVEVAFGNMTDEVDKFSKRALKAFGLNELTAKRMASTYMAMSNGMGIASDKGKLMSLNLTALAGDLASFRDVSQDVAETALHSVFTGETESLKKFGIVLTEANLKSFAMTKGITKQYNEMSQAEKVMLRYSYVMNATAQAQGDFARTSNSWANSIRVLSGQFKQLLGIIGKGLIAVLTPMVGLLNKILASLIGIANAFAKIFGGSGIKKTGDQLQNAGAGAGDMADNLGDAEDKAKKLKKTIAGFDELETLRDNSDSGAGDGLDGGMADMELPDYYGSIVGDNGIQKGFNEILKIFDDNILKFHDKIVEFAGTLGKRFSDAFLSIDWVLLGKTVGDGINLVVDTINSYITNIDWLGMGQKIAEGVNSLFATVDWVALGELVANEINALADLIYGFVSTLDFSAVGQALNDRFMAMINGINWETIGQALGTGFNGIFTTLTEFLQNAPIENFGAKFAEMINTALMNVDATMVGEALNNLISQIITAIEALDWEMIASKFREMLDALDIPGLIKEYFSAKSSDLSEALQGFFGMSEGTADFTAPIILGLEALGTAIAGITPILLGLAEKIAVVKLAFGDEIFHKLGSLFGIKPSEAFMNLPTVLGSLGDMMYDKFGAVWPIIDNVKASMSGFFTVSKGAGPATEALASQLGMIAQKGNAFQLVSAKLNIGLSNLWAVMKAHPIGAIIAVIATCVASVKKLWDTSENFRTFVKELWEGTIKPVVDKIGEAFKGLWENHLKPLWEESLKPLFEAVKETISGVWTTIEEVIGWIVGAFGGTLLTGVSEALGSLVESITELFGGVIDIFKGVIDFITGIFTGDWEKAWEGVKLIFKGVWDSLVAVVKAPINLIIGLVNGLVAGITAGVNACIRAINRIHVKVPDWIPLLGGKEFGFNINELTAPKIPLLANGGVITEPTVAMMGEYAGAKGNPEIVAPQNILRETINQGNTDMLDAMNQMCRMIISAIEDVDMSVSIGDDVIAQSASRGNNAYIQRTGNTLFAY